MKTDQLVRLRQAAGGFTPAGTPLMATAHHTDQLHSLQTHGIHCGETTIPSQGDELPAYIAKPDQHTGPYPVVIVVQEIFGVHEHIQDICRRLAKQGYLAIAPELYFRQGDAKDYSNINELVNNLVKKSLIVRFWWISITPLIGHPATVGTPKNWPLPDFAGAGVSHGYMPHIIHS